MERMKITTHGTGSLTIEYENEFDIHEVRTFVVRGRYVYELFGFNGGEQQVCDRLSSRGETLMATDETLTDVIRREYKAMRAAEKREAERY